MLRRVVVILSRISMRSLCTRLPPDFGRYTFPLRIRRGRTEGRDTGSSAPTKYGSPYHGSHKRRASDYTGRESTREYKRQSHVSKTNMSRTVGWQITERAPRGLCDGHGPVTVRLLN